MGRTRPNKTRRSAPAPTESPSEHREPPSLPALLEKAQSLIVQCDYNLADLFIKRILEQDAKNAEAKEMLGVVQLETGELESAKEVLQLSFAYLQSSLNLVYILFVDI